MRSRGLSLSNTGYRFGYRDSIFRNELRNNAIITSVVFRLEKGTMAKSLSYAALNDELRRSNNLHPDISDVFKVVQDVRRTELPDLKIMGNAGSSFKNPIIDAAHKLSLEQRYHDLTSNAQPGGFNISAGWLIEKAGGRVSGRVMQGVTNGRL
jgi:UDP-N-acetylmuramate dehydrogenase